MADATIPVASVAALSALKTVSVVRRPQSNHPTKVGSDIHDLVGAGGARAVATELTAADRELAEWVADQIARAFGDDLRFTLIRLRRNDRSASAQSLTDEDVAATAIFAAAIRDQLDQRSV